MRTWYDIGISFDSRRKVHSNEAAAKEEEEILITLNEWLIDDIDAQ